MRLQAHPVRGCAPSPSFTAATLLDTETGRIQTTQRKTGAPEIRGACLFDDLTELIIRDDGGIGEVVRRNRAYMDSDAGARLALPHSAA
jgi:hypothetical protein